MLSAKVTKRHFFLSACLTGRNNCGLGEQNNFPLKILLMTKKILPLKAALIILGCAVALLNVYLFSINFLWTHSSDYKCINYFLFSSI